MARFVANSAAPAEVYPVVLFWDFNCYSAFRYLLIPLMNAERVWSYAMELKLLANTEPRKRFHMKRKLNKSVHYAQELHNLCDCDKVDARTKLESQVKYSSLSLLSPS